MLFTISIHAFESRQQKTIELPDNELADIMLILTQVLRTNVKEWKASS